MAVRFLGAHATICCVFQTVDVALVDLRRVSSEQIVRHGAVVEKLDELKPIVDKIFVPMRA